MSSKKIVEGRLDNLDDGASDFVSYLNTTYIQRYGMAAMRSQPLFWSVLCVKSCLDYSSYTSIKIHVLDMVHIKICISLCLWHSCVVETKNAL